MNDTSISAGRYLAGFLIGAMLAAIGSGVVFLLFIPIPPPGGRPNHVGEALAATVVVMFFCGGFVGVKGFNAESMTDFVAPVVVTYLVAFLLLLTAGLYLVEIMAFLGFASAGLVTSGVGSLIFGKWFPPPE